MHQQVEFIMNHETNKLITGSINFKEFKELADSLNRLISIQNNLNKEYTIKDQKLKEAITNISHDIRTPLTSLNGYFQLLIESESDDDKDRYIQIIQTRIENLKSLLDEIFTYIKIQDVNYTMDFEEIIFNKTVQENLFSYYEDFKSREIEVLLDIPDEPILFETNLSAFNRIISNLINNSLIHGDSYTAVSIHHDKNIIKLIFENDVKDSENIDLDNIFDRFYKRDEARTLHTTGLGLTIVKELVDTMNGEITASIDHDVFKIEIKFIVEEL